MCLCLIYSHSLTHSLTHSINQSITHLHSARFKNIIMLLTYYSIACHIYQVVITWLMPSSDPCYAVECYIICISVETLHSPIRDCMKPKCLLDNFRLASAILQIVCNRIWLSQLLWTLPIRCGRKISSPKRTAFSENCFRFPTTFIENGCFQRSRPSTTVTPASHHHHRLAINIREFIQSMAIA